MFHYVGIVEDAGPDKAVGVWFPDLPGCFSAGDTIDEAIRNAVEAVVAYAEVLEADGIALPAPRSLSALRDDPAVADDLREHMVALISLPEPMPSAAE
jgi:predicted RNase H-like HicB family nuclease